jgi:formylmethanofuran dehydrogenase subunit B
MMAGMIADVTCPFCGCLCDDIRIVVEEGMVKEIYNGCALSQSRFAEVKRTENRNLQPLVRKGEARVPVGYDEALNRAVEILGSADHALLYGWATTSCEAQRAGIELAELLGASIDDTSSVCHGPSTIGIQDVGYVTATLGAVKNRADVVMYWGCNPFHAHPRHISRYTVFPRGYFRNGRKNRKLIVVDPRRTSSSRNADLYVQPEVGHDNEILNAMRAMLRGAKIDRPKVGGVPTVTLQDMVELMKRAEFGALYFGLGLSMSRGKHRNVECALQLVRDLNAHAKWVIGAMRGHYNVAGFNEVCAWETGFPFSVDFTRGYPRYNPGETSAVDLISNGEIDAMLTIASDPVSNLPAEVAGKMRSIPTVAVDPFKTLTTEAADIVIPSAVTGIEGPGTAYRMDGVPIELKRICEPPPGLLRDDEIVLGMLGRLKGMESR